ncbi:UvrD-helicase domain-containing protein [Cohnella zeiphila]|uniref:ATP-dependent helicase n=1 Tax=Cohnella zeiphila TaxID=2761120 RepID=A0A7X0VY77_9BACL|nr:UvrD-helicase domain-containing protein [Cohnella zeiphila]MBB6732668.1 ATP-dependent helicase [Cohnella zeiphila]
MIDITIEDIIDVETALLGQTKSFTEEQRNIIAYGRSGDVVACPGSGKTTVLIAKIAIIIKKIKEADLDYGICVITHTNVGVEEILNKLKILGINDVSYPHFIGTIHEFLNSFFSLKAYSILINRERFFFIENDEYKAYFSNFFEKHKPAWWGFAPPITAVDRTKLSIDNNTREISLVGFEDKRYHSELQETFKDMFFSGYLRHSDTIALSKWYIENNTTKLSRAFQARFKYFFMDETQDTSIDQYQLITRLIEGNKETVIQRFGDPYQALYNLYYGEPDAWEPPVEERKEIATSNRFGEKIAKILRTTCIERYDHLEGSEIVPSLEPHILLYDNQAEVLEAYARLLKIYGLPLIGKKVYAIAQHHEAVGHYHQGYQRSKNDGQRKSNFADCLGQVYKVMSKTLRMKNPANRSKYASNRLNDLLNSEFPLAHNQLRSLLSEVIRRVYLCQEYNSELDQFHLLYEKIITEDFLSTVEAIDTKADVESIKNFIIRMFTVETQIETIDNNRFKHQDVLIHLNTVHGVKGETHLSTLLLESTVRTDYSDLVGIMPFLLGSHDEELTRVVKIKDTLKLAYVALSRPTHFAGIAINEKHISLEDILVAERHGWKVLKTRELISRNN